MRNRRPAEPRAAAGKIRIIAGRLRGSRIEVPDVPGLRPTSDRVRETLFNWLAPDLPGAECIDLFAGSGALGFEAASRGASRVLMLECEPRAAQALRDTAQRLHADAVQVVGGDALAWLGAAPQRRFGIAFVDPPFAAGLLDASLAALDPWLLPDARIYVECAESQQPVLPTGWLPQREGRTREVRYALYRRSGS